MNPLRLVEEADPTGENEIQGLARLVQPISL